MAKKRNIIKIKNKTTQRFVLFAQALNIERWRATLIKTRFSFLFKNFINLKYLIKIPKKKIILVKLDNIHKLIFR